MEENESVEIQEVADPVEEVVDTNESTQEVVEPESQQVPPVEPEKTESRDYERDAAFAKMRRSMEQSQKDYETMKAEKERLVNAFGMFGFKGSTDEIEDQAKAHYTGKSIEEIRQERVASQKLLQEQQTREQEIERLRIEKDKLQQQVNQRIFDDDLRKIQAINPEIKSLDELGEKWWKLMTVGFTAEEAYHAVKSADNANKKTPPPEMGKVNASQKADKSFYTEEEVDAMIASNSKDLDNPIILEKIRKSMTKW